MMRNTSCEPIERRLCLKGLGVVSGAGMHGRPLSFCSLEAKVKCATILELVSLPLYVSSDAAFFVRIDLFRIVLHPHPGLISCKMLLLASYSLVTTSPSSLAFLRRCLRTC